MAITIKINNVLNAFPLIIPKLLLKQPPMDVSGSKENTWNIRMKYIKKNAPTTQNSGLMAIIQKIEYNSHNPIYLKDLPVIVSLCAGKSYIFPELKNPSVMLRKQQDNPRMLS